MSLQEKGLYAKYSAPGPKAAAWLNSKTPETFIVGPVGSAKTTTGAMKCMQVTTAQHPSTKDGVRRALIVAIRMNYRRMHDTLMPSYKKMFREEDRETGQKGDGVYSGVKDGKVDHFFAWDDPVYGKCEMLVKFRAFQDQDIESFIRGFEPTAFWLNEADELPEDCLGLLYQRAGRAYIDEKPDDVPPAEYSRIFGDLNMPDEDSWFYNDVMEPAREGKKPGLEIYIQPSGFSPDAENLHILRREHPDYYNEKAKKMEAWQVRRFIENKVGLTRHGTPVYPSFTDENTGSQELEPMPNIPLIIGVDQGLTPAAIFTQVDRDGRFLIHREMVVDPREILGAEQFGKDVGQMLLNEYRPWCGLGGFEFCVDKAAKQRDSDCGTFFRHFMKGVLSKIRHCPLSLSENTPNLMNDAVNFYLHRRARRGGGPAMLVHPRCAMIRRGGISGYRLKRVQRTDGVKVYKQDKNEYSHPWNALEFAAYRHKSGPLSEDEYYGRNEAAPYAPAAQDIVSYGESTFDEEFA